MKYIYILIILLISLKTQAQTLYLESATNLTILGAACINGNVEASTPTLYVSGNIQNGGTLTNNGEIQLTGNFANIGTYASTGDMVLNGNTSQALSGDFLGAEKFTYLIINKPSANAALLGNIEVGTTLKLITGTLELGNYDASISAGANITGTTNTRYLITNGTGNLKQTVSSSSVLFPIGNSTYNPVTLSNTGTIDVFSTRVADVVNCLGGSLATTAKVNRMWYLSEATVGGSNANITTEWTSANEQATFNRNASSFSTYNGNNFVLAESLSAASTTNGGATWTQTQLGQSNISSFIVTSINPISGGGISFCDNVPQTLAISNISGASYQWKKGGNTISGAMGATYAANESGAYNVEITSGGCVMVTDTVWLDALSLSNAIISPTDGFTHTATHECTDGATGWTHYYDTSPISGSYLLLSIKKNGNTNLGTVPTTATVFLAGSVSGAVNISSAFVQNTSGWSVMSRYWKFIPANEPTNDVNVRFYFKNADVNAIKALSGNTAITPDSLYFYKINDVNSSYDVNPANGQSGIPLATSYAGNGIWVYAPSLNASNNKWDYTAMGIDGHIAEFVVGHFGGGGGGGTTNGAPPFPVELLSFRGYNENACNRLFWATESELNTDKFIVERGLVQNDFAPIGEVVAAGNSNTLKDYTFNDRTFTSNRNFYRLKMLDKDGSFTYSKTIEILHNELSINIYPNPAGNEVYVSGNFNGGARAMLSNMLGQEIFTINLESNSQTQIPLQHISPSVYRLSILNENGKQIYSEKLVKQ